MYTQWANIALGGKCKTEICESMSEEGGASDDDLWGRCAEVKCSGSSHRVIGLIDFRFN